MTEATLKRDADSSETDSVTSGSALALHNLLDAPGTAPGDGQILPPLWHWLAFLPHTPQSQLGGDGHPRHGRLPHSAQFPRRMFAGGKVTFVGKPLVGQLLQRNSKFISESKKIGQSGPLLIASVEESIEAGGCLAIHEKRDFIFRPAAPSSVLHPVVAPAKLESSETRNVWDWERRIEVDPTLLFRFSALTYNAHRIHYDVEYAREVEGYRALVVQGPLQAIGLAELCRWNVAHKTLSSFEFRALSPAFASSTLRFCGRQVSPGTIELAVIDSDGRMTMQAKAELVTGNRIDLQTS